MPDYISYWRTVQVRAAMKEAREGQLLDHAASKQFGKVRSGDTVWIVNIERNTHRFLLVGRIEVAMMCGRRAAQRALGRDDLYEDAPLHIVAIEGSEEPAREIPLDPVARQIRFVSPEPSDRLTITDGQVDQQQVRRLRELTPETVDLFEKLWRQASGGDARRSGNDGEERIPNREYLEGGAVKVLVNRYERDRDARDACIAHYGTACSVCEMEFSKTYGELGDGFIHVHHHVLVSSRGKRYRVDPVEDLIPVCPNCHAMLHMGTTPPSINKLRQIVRRHRK
jgi:hypothetical protein